MEWIWWQFIGCNSNWFLFINFDSIGNALQKSANCRTQRKNKLTGWLTRDGWELPFSSVQLSNNMPKIYPRYTNIYQDIQNIKGRPRRRLVFCMSCYMFAYTGYIWIYFWYISNMFCIFQNGFSRKSLGWFPNESGKPIYSCFIAKSLLLCIEPARSPGAMVPVVLSQTSHCRQASSWNRMNGWMDKVG